MSRRPPRSTRTATFFPYTTLVRHCPGWDDAVSGARAKTACLDLHGPQLGEEPKKNAAIAAFGCFKLPVRSACGGFARRLGRRWRRLCGCLALGVGPGPERGDVRRAQRGVPQDFDASALLAEGGEVGGDGLAGQVAADVLGLARARGPVRGAVGLAGHGISLQDRKSTRLNSSH